MRGLGHERWLPRARTREDWLKLYHQRREYLYGIRSVELTWYKEGKGNTGARHFHYFKAPVLRHWNPDIHVREVKLLRASPPAPKLVVELDDGTKKEIDVSGLKEVQIWEKLVALSTPNPCATEGQQPQPSLSAQQSQQSKEQPQTQTVVEK